MKKIIFAIVFTIILAVLGVRYIYVPQKHFLSVVAILKNEKPYIKEWLEYHMIQGVEHFYLCDNDSTDGIKEYLKPYIDKGVITYMHLAGINQQKVCYETVVNQYKNKTEWLAIIDLDEYLVPLKEKTIAKFLEEFEDVSEVSLHWMLYGDNGAISRDDGLITEFFTSHPINLNHTVKSIVRPEKVIDFEGFGSNHYIKVEGKSVNEYHKPVNFMLNYNISGDKARVNHYIIKTFAEFHHKKKRGHPEGSPINYAYYFYHNDNTVKNDTSMLRFLPKLKKRMAKSPLKDVSIPKSPSIPSSFEDLSFTKEEVSQILNQEMPTTMKYYDVEKAYKNRKPQYN